MRSSDSPKGSSIEMEKSNDESSAKFTCSRIDLKIIFSGGSGYINSPNVKDYISAKQFFINIKKGLASRLDKPNI